MFNDIYNQGNNVRRTLKPTSRTQADLEAEKGETIITNLGNDVNTEFYTIGGKPHSQGGTPVSIPDDSFIFSKDKKMKITDKDILELFSMHDKKSGYTPAEISKKFDMNKYIAILNNKLATPLEKETAKLMIKKNNESLGKLAVVQESMKGFNEGIPAVAQTFMGKYNITPEELISGNLLGFQRDTLEYQKKQNEDMLIALKNSIMQQMQTKIQQDQMQQSQEQPALPQAKNGISFIKKQRNPFDPKLIKELEKAGYSKSTIAQLEKEADKKAGSQNYVLRNGKLVPKSAWELNPNYKYSEGLKIGDYDFNNEFATINAYMSDPIQEEAMRKHFNEVNKDRLSSPLTIEQFRDYISKFQEVTPEIYTLQHSKKYEGKTTEKEGTEHSYKQYEDLLTDRTDKEEAIHSFQGLHLALATKGNPWKKLKAFGAATGTKDADAVDIEGAGRFSKMGKMGDQTGNETIAMAESDEEIALPKIQPEWEHFNPPKQDGIAPFWTQDMNNLGLALGNRLNIYKGKPWQAPIEYSEITPQLVDYHQRAADASSASNALASVLATQGDLNAFNANAQDIANTLYGEVTKARVDEYNTNVNIMNQFGQTHEQERNKNAANQMALQQNRYDQQTIFNQAFHNEKKAANAEIVEQFNNAWTNRGMTQSMNSLYPNFRTDPIAGTVTKKADTPLDAKEQLDKTTQTIDFLREQGIKLDSDAGVQWFKALSGMPNKPNSDIEALFQQYANLSGGQQMKKLGGPAKGNRKKIVIL